MGGYRRDSTFQNIIIRKFSLIIFFQLKLSGVIFFFKRQKRVPKKHHFDDILFNLFLKIFISRQTFIENFWIFPKIAADQAIYSISRKQKIIILPEMQGQIIFDIFQLFQIKRIGGQKVLLIKGDFSDQIFHFFLQFDAVFGIKFKTLSS